MVQMASNPLYDSKNKCLVFCDEKNWKIEPNNKFKPPGAHFGAFFYTEGSAKVRQKFLTFDKKLVTPYLISSTALYVMNFLPCKQSHLYGLN